MVGGGDSQRTDLSGDRSRPVGWHGLRRDEDLEAFFMEVIKGDSLTPIEIGNSDNLAPGSWVMSVGSPFGLDHSVSAGIVSALSRGDMLETE